MVALSDSGEARRAWAHYVATGQLLPELLREEVHRAWSRCVAHGTSPRNMAARELSPSETRALLERERDLLDAARPYLRALSTAAGPERHAAMLANAEGVLVDLVGDEETVHRTEGFPRPGSLLSEKVAGANGIGTPLFEGAYVEIVGPEHFIEGFHVYTCQGLPVRSPDGAVVGVISMSVRRVEAAERVREILICAAHGIAAELTSRRLQRAVTRLDTSEGDDACLSELRDDVVQLQTAARLRFEKAARRVPGREAEALARSAAELALRFARRAKLWNELAFADVGPRQSVDLAGRVVELGELLATEASIRGVRLDVRANGPMHVLADPRELSRSLLRGYLRAFASAGANELVEVIVKSEGATATVEFSSPAGSHLRVPRLAEDEHERETPVSSSVAGS